MNIRVGKAGDNDFVIDDPKVSRYHALLSKDEAGKLTVEDLNSTNGTYINDIQIVKKKIKLTDKLTLGSDYSVLVRDIVKRDDDYSEEFAELKEVYNTYIKEKIHVQSANQFKTRIFQSLPIALIGVTGIILSISGHANQVLFIASIVIAILAPTTGVYFGARQAAKIPAQLQNLANRLKIDYVCPKCGTFLGEIPWESLANKKQCPIPSCKAKWIRT
ncbi:MAG: FHA domain-containing protein [Tannerella sp.]|jgi:pSer/pThr/pTyr-binding forkhead associated (FHA) protein|nr:FHA domain-containing protein [Tannerella sp.]